MTEAAVKTAEPILLRRDEQHGLTVLTLNRPAQFNSLSFDLLDEVYDALEDIAADPARRIVVIEGAGKAFCAGHDLKEMRSDMSKDFHLRLFRRCSEVMMKIIAIPQPVIARVHGIAAAAGCQLVSMCDLAVASTAASFAVSGINVGLFCSTPSVGLSRNVGRKQAMEMLLTGDFIDAETAQSRGLVNRVVAPEQLDEEVGKLADSIIAKSPVAVATGKKMFYEQIELGMDAAYAMAAETMACNMMARDVSEGIDAFIAKRKPVWTGQ